MNITYDLDIISIGYTTICLVLFWIIARSSRPAGINDEIREYVRRKINDASVQSRQQTEPYQLQQFRDDIRQLRMDVSSIKGRSVPLEITNEAVLVTEPVALTEPIEPAEEVFYLPTPNIDGSFPASTLSTLYREGASIYQMTLTRGERAHAAFQLCREETAIRLALQYVELRIEPCCRALNAYTGSAKSIIPESPGRLELRGDKWVVTAKASIHYEN